MDIHKQLGIASMALENMRVVPAPRTPVEDARMSDARSGLLIEILALIDADSSLKLPGAKDLIQESQNLLKCRFDSQSIGASR